MCLVTLHKAAYRLGIQSDHLKYRVTKPMHAHIFLGLLKKLTRRASFLGSTRKRNRCLMRLLNHFNEMRMR